MVDYFGDHDKLASSFWHKSNRYSICVVTDYKLLFESPPMTNFPQHAHWLPNAFNKVSHSHARPIILGIVNAQLFGYTTIQVLELDLEMFYTPVVAFLNRIARTLRSTGG